jgi:hypothetical protein
MKKLTNMFFRGLNHFGFVCIGIGLSLLVEYGWASEPMVLMSLSIIIVVLSLFIIKNLEEDIRLEEEIITDKKLKKVMKNFLKERGWKKHRKYISEEMDEIHWSVKTPLKDYYDVIVSYNSETNEYEIKYALLTPEGKDVWGVEKYQKECVF